MIILLILIGMVTVSFVLYMLIIWCADGRGWAKLKYKDFRKYYDANPCQWDCRSYSVVYHKYINTYEEIREYFNFGFIDFCKYRLWLTKIERDEKRKRNAESIQRMLDSMHEEEK